MDKSKRRQLNELEDEFQLHERKFTDLQDQIKGEAGKFQHELNELQDAVIAAFGQYEQTDNQALYRILSHIDELSAAAKKEYFKLNERTVKTGVHQRKTKGGRAR